MAELFRHESNDGLNALPLTDSLVFDSNICEWQATGADGFWIKPILEDQSVGLRTCLMKVDADAYSPMHSHQEIEQIYVIEGSFYDQDGTYGPGEYIVRAVGAMHSAGSQDGAVVMLFYSANPGQG
jgi:anti-sigma factor ChrR (cupin superfamily)